MHQTSIDLIKENDFTLKKKVRSKRFSAKPLKDADYEDNLVLLENAPAQEESRLSNQEEESGGIGK